MKKLILILAVLITACETTIPVQETPHKYKGQNIEIIEFDECEYVLFWDGNATWGSHKGNCKFCKGREK